MVPMLVGRGSARKGKRRAASYAFGVATGEHAAPTAATQGFYLFACKRADYVLITVRKDVDVDFFGAFELQVLYGAVRVNEYLMTGAKYSLSRFVQVCAPFCLGPPVRIRASKHCGAFRQTRVKYRSKQFVENPDVVTRCFVEGDGLVLIRFRVSRAISCIKLHEPFGVNFFMPSTSYSIPILKLDSFCCVLRESGPPVFSPALTNCFQYLVKNIERRRGNGKKSTVLVAGGKGVGKSTFSRLLINALLYESAPAVYLLDCDVGQSECNPSECVALSRIDSPFLCPPFGTQRRSFPNAYYYADVSVEENPKKYLQLLKKLLRTFEETSEAASTLVINTLGWVTGGGEFLLESLIEFAHPDFAVNITSDATENYAGKAFTNQMTMPAATVFIVPAAQRAVQNVAVTVPAAKRRQLLAIGYTCEHLRLPSIGSLNKIRPRKVRFESLSFYLHPRIGTVSPSQVFAFVNCSFVALCVAEWDNEDDAPVFERLFGSAEMPRLLSTESRAVRLRCVGFGFVRAVDVDRRLLYVCTPVEVALLRTVDVLARGVSDFARPFILHQTSPDAPYISVVDAAQADTALFRVYSNQPAIVREELPAVGEPTS